MLYEGANFVTVAFLRFYLSVFSLNVNVLLFNTTSTKSIVSVETYFSFQVSSLFLSADRPSPCSMFGHNPTISIVHKIMSSGNFGREWSFFRNSFVLNIRF